MVTLALPPPAVETFMYLAKFFVGDVRVNLRR